MAAGQRRSERLSSLDDVDAALYTVGQVAELLDVPVAQLRRLDDRDVVSPSRSQGNQRRYSRREIERLRDALDLTADGLPLAGVRRVLELQDRVADLEAELAETRARLAEHEGSREADGTSSAS